MAILTKQQLIDQTNAKIRANGSRLITGDVLNDVLIDLIDSVSIGSGVGLGAWSVAVQYLAGNNVVFGSQIWTAIGSPTIGVFNAATEWSMISKPDTVVSDIGERNAMTVRFAGMTTFVQSTAETFRLVDGTTNTNWKKISERVITRTEIIIPLTNTFNFPLINIGEILNLEINGVRYDIDTDFTWNGSVLTWGQSFTLDTDEKMFLIHLV
jgi:hypothetical protein